MIEHMLFFFSPNKWIPWFIYYIFAKVCYVLLPKLNIGLPSWVCYHLVKLGLLLREGFEIITCLPSVRLAPIALLTISERKDLCSYSFLHWDGVHFPCPSQGLQSEAVVNIGPQKPFETQLEPRSIVTWYHPSVLVFPSRHLGPAPGGGGAGGSHGDGSDLHRSEECWETSGPVLLCNH